MAEVITYMNYIIYFQDPAQYNFAKSVAGGNLLELAPRAAATMFGIPFPYPSGNVDLIPAGISFIFPFVPGSQYGFPGPTGIFVDDTVDFQILPGQAGVPASTWPAGPNGRMVWSGNIVMSAGAGAAIDPPPTSIARRRWCMGFEWSLIHEGSGVAEVSNCTYDASRAIGCKGLAVRGDNFNSATSVTLVALRVGLLTPVSWERVYFRARRTPTVNDVGFWRCHGTVSNAVGFGLKYTTTGDVRGFNINNIFTEFDAGLVFTPVIDDWNRLDIFVRFGTAGTTAHGEVRIYLNGQPIYSFTDSTNVGLSGAPNHDNTQVGKWTTGSSPECEYDIDDWINSDLPSNVNPSTLGFTDTNFGLDWILGSHVRGHYSESASLTNWTPNAFASLNQGVNPVQKLTSEIASTTSGATMEGLTDVLPQNKLDSIANVLGAVAATVAIYARNSGATDGKLGYKLAGGAAVLTTIDQFVGDGIQLVAYQPTGMIIPDEIWPFSVVHTKSTDGNTDTVTDLVCVVEYLGVWGPEDNPLFELPVSRLGFLHNCQYSNTQWGYMGSEPEAPVYARGGTYVGNGTSQTISLPAPCHFLMIRKVTGGGEGLWWFGTSEGATRGTSKNVIPNIRVWSDFVTGNFQFTVTGNDIEVNQNAQSYQYIAFCDPGMRFNISGVFNHGSTSASPKANPLLNTLFSPEAGFFQFNQIATIGGTVGLHYKGPLIEGSKASAMDGGAQLANAGTFSQGFFNSESGLHGFSANYVYSLWKSSDGGGSGGTMVQICSYTGNGVNPRDIPLTPTSGRFPLFVMVVPDAAAQGFYRDPSHTGVNSSFIANTGLSATAIVAVAIDQITVQSSLNANGVEYSVFALVGDTLGMNNGTYYAPIYQPSGGPYTAPLPPQGDINVMSEGGLVLNGQPSLTLLRDISGIYTLIKGKRNDTLIDRQTGQDSVDVKIPDPTYKTGYIGG
jgi:hypothetical protein